LLAQSASFSTTSFLTGKYVGNAANDKKYGVGFSNVTTSVVSSVALTPTSSLLAPPLVF